MLKFKEFIQLDEEGVASTCAGGGAIAGIGVGSDGEPGVPPRKKRKKGAVLRGVLSTVNIGE